MSKSEVATSTRAAIKRVSTFVLATSLVTTSLAFLPTDLSRANANGDRAAEAGLARARYAIVLGSMHNESGFAGPDLARVLSSSLTRELGALRRVAIMNADDREQLDRARAQGLPVLRLEGNVVQIMRERAGEQVSVHCEVALLLMDQGERNLRTILKGAATGIEASMGPINTQEKRLARKAVDGAVRSALRNASSALENAAARLEAHSAGETATASLPRR